MKIEPGTDITEAVRQELTALPNNIEGPDYVTEAAKVVRRWMEFIDSIQEQRVVLAPLLESFEYAQGFIHKKDITATVSVTATVERKVIRRKTRGNKAMRIRKAAKADMLEKHEWRTSGQLKMLVVEIDPSLNGLNSSTVSAAMDFGWKRWNEFIAADINGSKSWGLPRWEVPKGGKLLELEG